MNWYCDGGLHKICVTNDDGKVYMDDITGTNNENEFRSMILALKKASDGDTILADSQLVVNILNGKWKVKKEHLKPLYNEAKELLNKKNITIEWTSRDFNLAGIILENL